MKKLALAVSLAALVLAACEKEIELKQDEIDPRIVINSLFEAGDTVWVELSESRNILYEGELPKIVGADAKLLDANGSVIGTFIMQEDGIYYTTDVLPVAGQRYGIRVNANGLKTATASSETPSLIADLTVDTTTAIGNSQIEFTARFMDDASQKNYYGVTIAYHGFYDDGTGDLVEYTDFYYSTKEIYVANGAPDVDGETFAQEFFFSDATFNGQMVDFSGKKYFAGEMATEDYYVITVKSLSEDLYKYKISYLKYLEADGSPFAEPVQVYSNVEDGFGIFGGASFVTDTIFVE